MSNEIKEDESQPIAEQEIRGFWYRLKIFIESPEYSISLKTDDAPLAFATKEGFMFRHLSPMGSEDTYDSYSSSNLRTEFKRSDGTIGNPGLNIFVKYPCEHKSKHEPSSIPNNIPIQLSLAGIRGFVVDGTKEGSGSLDAKGNVYGPLSRANFNEVQEYLNKANFRALKRPFEIIPDIHRQ